VSIKENRRQGKKKDWGGQLVGGRWGEERFREKKKTPGKPDVDYAFVQRRPEKGIAWNFLETKWMAFRKATKKRSAKRQTQKKRPGNEEGLFGKEKGGGGHAKFQNKKTKQTQTRGGLKKPLRCVVGREKDMGGGTLDWGTTTRVSGIRGRFNGHKRKRRQAGEKCPQEGGKKTGKGTGRAEDFRIRRWGREKRAVDKTHTKKNAFWGEPSNSLWKIKQRGKKPCQKVGRATKTIVLEK